MTTRLTFFRLLLQQLPYVGQAIIKGVLGFRVEMPVGDVDDVLCSFHGSPHVTQGIGVRRATHVLIGQADVWQYAVLQICSTVSILSHQMQMQMPNFNDRSHEAWVCGDWCKCMHTAVSIRDTSQQCIGLFAMKDAHQTNYNWSRLLCCTTVPECAICDIMHKVCRCFLGFLM